MSDRPMTAAELRLVICDALEGAASALRLNGQSANEAPPLLESLAELVAVFRSAVSEPTPKPPVNLPFEGEKLVYTVTEVAKYLGVHRSTAYLYARNGTIRTHRVGGLIVVPVEELRRLLSPEGDIHHG